ncbi:MAG: MMPL family transporter [Planctomycetota bacterium]
MSARPVAAALVALAALALAALAPRPRLDNSVTSWFPERDPSLQAYRGFQERFGADEVVVLELEGGGIEGLLRRLIGISDALSEAPGVERVLSASEVYPTEVSVLSDPELGGIRSLSTCGWVFDGPLNQDLKLFELDAPGGPRATVYALLAPARPGERAALSELLQGLRREAEADGRRLRVAGQPLVNLELDRASLEVEQLAMPLLVAVCALTLVWTLRSLRLALVLLAPVGLGVFASEGLLGLWGGTTNLVVGIAKPLVFVLLLACGFHVVVASVDRRRAGLAPGPAAWGAARAKASACLLALFTTAVGFGSLAVSDVAPIRTLGLATVGGLALGAPLLLVLLPQALAWVGGPPPAHPDRVGPACARLAAWAEARWVPLLVASALAIGVGAWAATGLQVQPHAIEYFAPDHPLRRDHRALQQEGVALAQVDAVVSGPESLIGEAASLERLDAWAREVETLPGVHAVVGLPLLYREAGYRSARLDRMPADFLLPEVFERSEDSMAPFCADAGRTLRFSVSLDTLGPDALDALEADMQQRFTALAPEELELTVTGSYPLLLHTQTSLLTTLRESLILTAVLMQLVLVVALRSLRLGLAALIPNALPVAAIFAVMRGAGISVDVGTSMTAAIALGIAVDDTLHFLHTWRGHGTLATAGSTGRAIGFTSLVIGLGFLAICTSSFVPTRLFGLLCAVAMGAALVGDLVVLPAMLRALGCRVPESVAVAPAPVEVAVAAG